MKKNVTWFLLLVCTIYSCQKAPKRPLKVHSLFSNGMVLQRDAIASIWGEFTPGGTINIEGSWGERASGSADVNGQWIVKLPTPEAGGPHKVTIATADSVITLSDVLSGEVWLASGQSNMEMPVKGWPPRDPILNSAEEIASANYPKVRMITVPRTTAVTPASAFNGSWQAANPQTVGDFSATAYFFARELHQELNVPVGIIHSSWGGTVAEAWTSGEKLAGLGDFDMDLATLQDPDVIEKTAAWFGARTSAPAPATAAEWEALEWPIPEVNDLDAAQWSDITLPGRFDVVESALDGAFWLQKTIEVTNTKGSFTMALGAIDDRDMVYVNGQLVGKTMEAGKYQDARVYQVPEGVFAEGQNVISILGIDTGGPGEFNGSMTLESTEGLAVSLEGTWSQRLAAELYAGQIYIYGFDEDLSERPSVLRVHQNVPTVLFNGMISPLIPYQIKGAIWYQGESNVGRAAQYTRLFPAMITDWRERWGYNFPFYFVQIAPFGYNSPVHLSAALRDAQRRTLSLDNTGMAVTLDIGNPENIHPGNKQEVGRRLALWALAEDYDQSVVASGPLFQSAEVKDGVVIVSFDYLANGLMANEGGLTGFEVAGSEGEFVSATAEIKGDKVWVSSPQVSAPTAVRYAYEHTSTASLFNSEGLPASSFTSETALP
ncbi:MAG: sialate O-acetylesterase [Bacteroidota bacterium]